MTGNIARFAAVVSALSLVIALPVGAKSASPTTVYKAPRTAWGDPDLRGMWPLEVGNTRMQRDPKYGNQAWLTDAEYAAALKAAQARGESADKEDQENKLGGGHWFEYGTVLKQTSLIMQPANGRIPPLTAQGSAMAKAMHSSWDNDLFSSTKDFNSLDRCITRGMPASMIPFPYNNGVQIFQAPGYVVLHLELIHETRIIPLDGRGTLPGGIKTWLGDSRGHWEGQTLVVETTNFNGESPMVIVGPSNEPVPTSTALHITERFTPTGPNTIQYEARVEDPVVLTAPFTISYPWTRNDKYRSFEYACHEGNTLITAYIKATNPAFAAQRAAAVAARDAAVAKK
ncbi:MAG TPA: hypothetical protein VLM18_12070 [Croceibacterium sp.]|nr:hypothetical protein [Croceibacterium sp.]